MLRHYPKVRYGTNRSLRALLLSDALLLTAVAMLAPIYALYVAKVGGDILAAGITAAALAFGSGVASLATGRVIDRMRNKRILLVGSCTVMSACFLLYAVAGSVWYLAAIQVVMGIMQAMHATAFDALYTTHLDQDRVGEEWGAWEALNYFTAAGGALIGSLIVAKLGFETMFVIMAALTFASGIYILHLPKRAL